ncbi:MAG: type II toxin-antitoxin system VapC family toxin [Planctomycetota bacterium]
MLDTDSVSFALRGEGRVAAELRRRAPSQVCVSAVTVAELWFGVEKRRSTKLRRIVQAFVDTIEVAAVDADVGRRFGEVAAALAERGKPIGAFDALIAAHALHTGSVLVTHNVAHFRLVSRLRLEDWY